MADLLEKIKKAKEKKGDKAFEEIVKHFNCQNVDEQHMKCSCPWHSDSTPSFMWEKETYGFKCFSCGRRYSIVDMYTDIEGSYRKGIERLFKETGITFEFTEPDEEKKQERADFFKHYRYPHEEPLTQSAVGDGYLAKRGINSQTKQQLDLRFDVHGNVAFQLRDVDGTLLGVKYRVSHAAKAGESKMYWQKDADTCPTLYNIQNVDPTTPLLITEGYFDCVSAVQSGWRNAVSIPGGANDDNWINFNYDWLDSCSKIILWFDNDKAGQEGLQKVITRLGEYRCMVVTPTEDNVNAVKAYYQQYNAQVDKTDANNILLAQGETEVYRLIENAKEVPSKRLKKLMECESVNIKDIHKIPTGIKSLDKIIYGNPDGCFTIITAMAGAGKSSLANMIDVISPIENNEKVFIFSGELNNSQLLDWILTPLAGYNHILEWTDPTSDAQGYYPSKESEEAMKKFYKDKIILYDDAEGLNTSGETLLKEMENSLKRYGTRVFLIDNLMCLAFDEKNNESIWMAQKQFIIQLLAFTNKFKVNVNLILHPRKPSKESGESVYELAGSSDIANMAHRVLWLSRLKDDPDGFDVQVRVVKDRPTGRAGEVVKLNYDRKTRRIYGDEAERFQQYSWESSFHPHYDNFTEKHLIKNLPIEYKVLANPF